MDSEIKERINGQKYTIVHCDGALDSFRDAISHVNAGRRAAFTRGIVQQIQRLADGHRMSKESFPQEGNLPKRKGSNSQKRFNAFKRIPIRGYCWLSESHKDTYFVSHYVYKDYDKLKDNDTDRVKRNWLRIEEEGDEC